MGMFKRAVLLISEAGFGGFLWIVLERTLSTTHAVIGMFLFAGLILFFHRNEVRGLLQKLKRVKPSPEQKEFGRVEGTVPRIVPVRYEKSSQAGASHGLVIANDGEPAYDISICDVSFFSLILSFSCDLSRLVKADGESFCEAWIKRGPHDSIDGSVLMGKMIEANLESLDFAIRYKDGVGQWYETKCRLERDVLESSGIKARMIEQQKIRLPARV